MMLVNNVMLWLVRRMVFCLVVFLLFGRFLVKRIVILVVLIFVLFLMLNMLFFVSFNVMLVVIDLLFCVIELMVDIMLILLEWVLRWKSILVWFLNIIIVIWIFKFDIVSLFMILFMKFLNCFSFIGLMFDDVFIMNVRFICDGML